MFPLNLWKVSRSKYGFIRKRCSKYIFVTSYSIFFFFIEFFPLQFLSELTKLFQKSRLSGSVTMTFKRCKFYFCCMCISKVYWLLLDDGNNKPQPRKGRPPLPEPQEHMCIIRAKSRTKKISTVVHQRDINKFQVAYSSLLKGNLDGLKKLKKPKAKTKAE